MSCRYLIYEYQNYTSIFINYSSNFFYQNCTEFESLNNNAINSSQESPTENTEPLSSSPDENEELVANPLPEEEHEEETKDVVESVKAKLLSCDIVLKSFQENFTWEDPEQTKQTI